MAGGWAERIMDPFGHERGRRASLRLVAEVTAGGAAESGGLGLEPDDVVVAGCVLEPARHLVVVPATGRPWALRPALGGGWSGCR